MGLMFPGDNITADSLVIAKQNSSAGSTRIFAGGNQQLAGIGVGFGKHAPMPMFGGAQIALSDVTVVSGAPTLSVTTGPNGQPALKIVTGAVRLQLRPQISQP